MKKIFLILVFLNVFSLVASEFDRDIVVLNQSRNDKVQVVFKEMMNAYEEEDITEFFSFVSEDRFNQDYMTFYEAIDQDIRVYDILSVDTWINKITDDGVKRYLYVQWEKRYESATSDTEINRRGYSRFLFDEINGKYKLIELAGNNFWGGSLPEWREEVSEISGQVVYTVEELPDLAIENLACISSSEIGFDIVNLGGDTTSGTIGYQITDSYDNSVITYTTGDILSANRVNIIKSVTSCGKYAVEVIIDYNDLIEESDEGNNEGTY